MMYVQTIEQRPRCAGRAARGIKRLQTLRVKRTEPAEVGEACPETPTTARTRKQTIELALTVICDITGLSRKQLIEPKRVYNRVLPRAVVYSYLITQGFTTGEIGRIFNRDHATVLHGIKALRDWLDIGDSRACELNTDFNVRIIMS